MAKLYFKYGAMNSGKSTILLQTAHNYEERGMKVLVVKPSIDIKAEDKVSSRLNVERKVDYLIRPDTSIYNIAVDNNDVDCILVDEAQFLQPFQVDELLRITTDLEITVICYGLRTDFKTQGFPGSTRLLELAHKLEEMKTKSLEMEKKTLDLNNRLVILAQEEERLNGQRNMIEERSKYDANSIKVHDNLLILNDRKLSLNSEINLLNEDIKNSTGNLLAMHEKITMEVNNLSDLKTKKDHLNREYQIKNREYQEKVNRMHIIKDNLDNNVLVNSNVKRVLNNPRLSGIYDAFGNILDIDKEYQKALEVSIFSSKNFIIVASEESAKEAINFLNDNNLGRCTFFPLNVIKPKGIDYETLEILKKEENYLGVLADFLKYDLKYQNIVFNQLGNILVVKDLDSGNRISKLINNRYKIVTLNGEVIHVGGSITGGSLNIANSAISLKNELVELEGSIKSLENVLEELNNSMVTLNNTTIQKEENIYHLRSEEVKLNEIVSNYQNNLNMKKSEYDKILLELNNLSLLKENKLSFEEERINEEYYRKHEEKELVFKELKEHQKEYEKLKSDILNLEGEYRLVNSNLHEKERELKLLEIEISKMDSRLDNNLNILNSEYEMTYEKAHAEYFLDMEMDEAKKLVNTYRSKLKSIGMVNLNAIGEYEEVHTRYEFLTNQRNDLLNAKETLNSIIDEMDEVMKEDFKKTFQILKEEFKNVFQKLFNGGNATLKLTNPDDLLTTGVDIIASPPGKSLKAISLLSGGEKTLTAISLLFAILNIRKVPFCIFDEIEAALDENNVDVFGHYLDNYKNKTQFLLITHKKRTMEYAKTLYGITMQESGVSKLVSVKLEN